MGRTIIPSQSIQMGLSGSNTTAKTSVPDNYTSQIVKLIPADIVGVYLGIQNLITGDDPTKTIVQAIVFVIILCISPIYLKRAAGITDPSQRLISILSYIIWSISLGGPFTYLFSQIHLPLTPQMIGGILIMLYTLVVPLLYKLTPPNS